MSEDSNNFHIQVVTTKDRVTRILISGRVINELPIIESMLERLVAADFLDWPEAFVIIHHSETPPSNSCHRTVGFPSWVFERMNTEWSKPRTLVERMTGERIIDRASRDFAWVFAHHFKPFNDYDPVYAAQRGKVAVLGNMNGHKASYRRVARLIVGIISVVPLIPFRLAWVYGIPKLLPTNHKALFRLAKLQRNFSRREGLLRTQRKLIAAGASPEDVRKYDLQPDLQIIDKNGHEPE